MWSENMKTTLRYLFCTLWILLGTVTLALSQDINQLHGDEAYSYRGIYEGNQIRVPFYNDGDIGPRTSVNPDDFRGNWPIGGSLGYINQLVPFIAAEVLDYNGVVQHIVSESNGITSGSRTDAASGDTDELGRWRTLAPLPGFANTKLQEIAMSHKAGTWPAVWPDKINQADPGWPGSWNGYFGRDQFSADQESYFVVDDYLNDEFPFYPDANDSLRRGLGIRGYIRGMQWNNILVEDILFSIYDFENIGTYHHDKVNFGMVSGPIIGAQVSASSGSDYNDDGGQYNLALDLGWHTDRDWIGWDGSKIGYYGIAFFETPGNPYDGIDNDGDGINGPGPIISESMFDPVTYGVGDPVIKIDYQTFEREVTQMPSDSLRIVYLGKEYAFAPNVPLEEIPHNLIDDNLNGIIDENNGSELTDENGQTIKFVWLFVGKKYIDYFTGNGSDNALIDEKRDDGIDNDGDWDPEKDDTGADGLAGSGDPGEGDGIPTAGEKHFDATDISESDMIGLTAFNIYTPWDIYPLRADELLWEGILPGYLNAKGQYGDTDILLGSGFFPLPEGDINRFSLGILFGDDEYDLFRNKEWANDAYGNNYQFAQAPAVPKVRAVAGDNKITLYWDDIAEITEDPVNGLDFEGYRIYRSTGDEWKDMKGVTDVWGSSAFRRPLAQFDLVNGIEGLYPIDVKGVYFDMGKDNGIVHTWTDTTAKNGFNYFYAVTAYDHGNTEGGIPPSECSYILSIHADGTVSTGTNVVNVRPEAPSAGFIESTMDGHWKSDVLATGQFAIEVVDEFEFIEATYNVSFESETIEEASGLYPTTTNFSLINVSNPGNPDTLINRMSMPELGEELPVYNGTRLHITNTSTNATVLNDEATMWNRRNVFPYSVTPFRSSRIKGFAKPSDYRIEFYENAGAATSLAFNDGRSNYNPVAVNFRIFNVTEDKEINFGFRERDGNNGIFTGFSEGTAIASDEIYFLEQNENDSLVATWKMTLVQPDDSLSTLPRAGDFLNIITDKPFLKNDVYEFTTIAAHFDEEKAKGDMDNIYVVPNPYIVANSWEGENTFSNGRGPREIHFINLPPQCTIRIFNVRGQLVTTLDHNETIWNGTEIWDMKTKDLLDISYGLYVYHIVAPDVGEKVGKFAVIK